jgi:hypothetical protein
MGTAKHVLSGPVKVFYAPFGTAIPAAIDTDADAILADTIFTTATFTELPFTMEGAVVEIAEEIFKHKVNERKGPIGGSVSDASGKVTLQLAESHPAAQILGVSSLSSANIAAGASQVGKTEVHLDMTDTSPTFLTLILSGLTGDGLSDIIVIPKVAASGASGTPYGKGKIRVVPVSWEIYEDPDAVDPKNAFFQRHFMTAIPSS